MRSVLLLGGSSSLGQHLVRRLGDTYRLCAVARSRESVAKIKAASPAVEILSGEEAGRVRFDRVINLVVDYGRGGAPLAQLIEPNLSYPLGLIEGIDAGAVINVSTALPADYSPYAFSKGMLEQALSFLEARTGRRMLNVRLHNMFGPGVGPSELIGSTIATMLEGDRVDVSACANSRDFIFIDDVVDALILVAARAEEMPPGVPVEVGTGEPTRLREVVTLLAELTGSASEIRFGARAGNPREPHVLAADTRVLHHLGWRPRHALRDGLAATVGAAVTRRG